MSQNYWKQRQAYRYYELVKNWLNEIQSYSLLDVGCKDVPVATWGSFRKRVAIDQSQVPLFPGVVGIQNDFMEWRSPEPFGTVTCLQVLEHVPDPRVFAQKLFALAHCHVIISVPYAWPKGQCKYHVNDPVHLRDLLAWSAPYEPAKTEIVKEVDGMARMVARFDMTF